MSSPVCSQFPPTANVFIVSRKAFQAALKLKKIPENGSVSINGYFDLSRQFFNVEAQPDLGEADWALVSMAAQALAAQNFTETLRTMLCEILSNPTEKNPVDFELNRPVRTQAAQFRSLLKSPEGRQFSEKLIRRSVVKVIGAENLDDAAAQLRVLKTQGYKIHNLIFDSHGKYSYTSFRVGDNDLFGWDGKVYRKKQGKKYKFEGESADKFWNKLRRMCSSVSGKIVINACYAANSRKQSDENEEAKFRNQGIQLLSKIQMKTQKAVYGSRSWFLTKPGILANIPLEDIEDFGRLLRNGEGPDFSLSLSREIFNAAWIFPDLPRMIAEAIGAETPWLLEKIVPNLENRIADRVRREMIQHLGFDPTNRNVLEILVSELLPKLYHTLPLVITPGGIDEPDYYNYGANVAGFRISETDDPAYYRYEWDNAGSWVEVTNGNTFETQNIPVAKDVGTLYFYYNGDINFNEEEKSKIENWHSTMIGRLWSFIAHQVSLDAEIGFANRETNISSSKKPTHPNPRVRELVKKIPPLVRRDMLLQPRWTEFGAPVYLE